MVLIDSPGIIIVVILEQPENTLSPTQVSESGRKMGDDKDEHPEKTESPSVSTAGKMKDVKDEQPEKAPLPILLTDFGSSMNWRPQQPANE
jgi:hypothetical protein